MRRAPLCMGYPKEFLSRMEAILGEEMPAFLGSASMTPTRALHVNERVCTPAALVASSDFSLSPIPYAADGFYLESEERAGRHPLHHAGAFYMQEPSAMAPVTCLPLSRGMRVLDVCAAPGGKSTQVANRIGRSGLLVSNEIMPARAATLAGNLERMGLVNAVVTNTDAETLATRYPSFFDAVVVDAPCSGEGMFRKDPVAVDNWNMGNVRLCAERQREILSHAVKTLRPGGYLLYATCTFSPEENEGTLAAFLASHPDMTLIPVSDAVAASTQPALKPTDCDARIADAIHACARRFYPHTGRGEGQFMAVMQRAQDAEVTPLPKKRKDDITPLSREDARIWEDFCRKTFSEGTVLPTPYIFKGSISLLPYEFPTGADITYARGVRAGHVEKGRIVPEHWLFSAYGRQFRRTIDLPCDDPRILAYLRGETFPCDLADGWGCVMVSGCPLGGIKVTGGIAKNHYPKGLRLK